MNISKPITYKLWLKQRQAKSRIVNKWVEAGLLNGFYDNPLVISQTFPPLSIKVS